MIKRLTASSEMGDMGCLKLLLQVQFGAWPVRALVESVLNTWENFDCWAIFTYDLWSFATICREILSPPKIFHGTLILLFH